MRLLKLEPELVVTQERKLRHMDVNVFLFTFACMNTTLPYMLAVITFAIDPANYHNLAIIHKPGN